VAKPEWGTKRTCLNCGVRFYDLGNKPITCPACQSSFEPEAFIKTRRSRQSAPSEPKKPAPAPAAPASEAEANKAEVAGPDAADPAAKDPAAEDDDKAIGDDAGEEDDAVLPVAAEAGDESEDVTELVDTPGGGKEQS
jgi:uncharacterized protein (TIGR02300 family)